MPVTNPLQSEQEAIAQINSLLDGIQVAAVASAAMAAATSFMLNYVATALIHSLSSHDEKVKLSELFLTGTSSLPAYELRAIADNLDGHLNSFAAGNRHSDQIKMSMIHGKPSFNDTPILTKTGEALDKIINKLDSFNMSLKDKLGPDTPANEAKSPSPRRGN